jgi:predicted ATPase
MLKAIELSNFKAFGPLQSIPLKPLTLIFGANSAGKSSIIHSLLLAHEAFNTNELDVFKTVLGGDSVDLGGFHQYVYRRLYQDKRVTFSFELDASSLRTQPEGLFNTTERIIITIEIGRDQKEIFETKNVFNKENKNIDRIEVPTGKYEPISSPCVVSFELGTEKGYLLKMSRRPNKIFQLDTINDAHPAIRHLLESIVLSSSTTLMLNDSDWDSIRKGLEEVIPKLTASIQNIIPDQLIVPKEREQGQQSLVPVGKGTRSKDIIAAINIFVPHNINEIVKAAYRSLSDVFNTLLYLGPLRSYPPRLIHAVPEKDANWQSGGGRAWNIVLKDHNVREKVNAWLSDPTRLSTPYTLTVDKLYNLDEFISKFKTKLSGDELEKLHEEILRHQNELNNLEEKHSRTIKLSDEDLAKLRGLQRVLSTRTEFEKDFPQEQIEDIRNRIIPLEIATNLDYTMEEFIEEHFETLTSLVAPDVESKDFLALHDKRTNTDVTHRDVGIGISQVLPVLVYAYASKGKTIAIEQPEIHLHPQLQAELGDVFIQSALGENKNTFILETHSEHLILRVMRRIKETFEGTLPEGAIAIKPSDVSILFVEPDGDKNIVREMPLNERGELVKSWPGGFFEEGLREVFA